MASLTHRATFYRASPPWKNGPSKTLVWSKHLLLAIVSALLVQQFMSDEKHETKTKSEVPIQTLQPLTSDEINSLKASPDVWQTKLSPWAEHYEKGRSLFRDHCEYAKAIKELNIAIKLNPKYSEAYSERAWIYNCESLYSKSLKEAEKALLIDPANMDAKEAVWSARNRLGLR